MDYLCDIINDAAHAVTHGKMDILWEIAREAPKTIAANRNEFIVQMIDEFQFFSTKIYRDKALKNLQPNNTGGYLSTAESKIAPLLFSVNESEVNLAKEFLIRQFLYRFKYKLLTNIHEDDSIKIINKSVQYFIVPITGETVYLILQSAEGSPFYISAITHSEFEKKLTTIEELTKTL